MSISVSISIDASRVRLMLDGIQERRHNVASKLLESIDNIIIPHLYERSTTEYEVRTGAYSSAWYSQIIGPNAVRVGNDVPYSGPLEWGWTQRNGIFRPSNGVLYPVVYEDISMVARELQQWLLSQV